MARVASMSTMIAHGLDRLVASKRLKRNLGHEIRRKPTSHRHIVFLRYPAEHTLAPSPVSWDQLSLGGAASGQCLPDCWSRVVCLEKTPARCGQFRPRPVRCSPELRKTRETALCVPSSQGWAGGGVRQLDWRMTSSGLKRRSRRLPSLPSIRARRRFAASTPILSTGCLTVVMLGST